MPKVKLPHPPAAPEGWNGARRFDFPMFFHMTWQKEHIFQMGYNVKNRYEPITDKALYFDELMGLYDPEYPLDDGKTLNQPGICRGTRSIPAHASGKILTKGCHISYLSRLKFDNELALVNGFLLLFRWNPSLLIPDDRIRLKKITDQMTRESLMQATTWSPHEVEREIPITRQYLAEVFRISVKNFATPTPLTEEEKEYLSNVSNQVVSLPDSPLDWEDPWILPRIDRMELWQAGQTWFRRARAEDGRFASLHVSEHLFPTAHKKESPAPILDIYVRPTHPTEARPAEKQPLFHALSQAAEQRHHIYLVGEGGIGKTTSAFHIMQNAYEGTTYSDACQIPLFIELSGAPDTPGKLYENGVSTFILRAIYKQLAASRAQNTSVKQVSPRSVTDLDEAFTMERADAVAPIEDLLSQQTDGTPEYLLILDGLNECPRTILEDARGTYRESVSAMILREINYLATNHPNVRILVTGRADEHILSGNNITRLELSGLDDNSILSYLEQCGWDPDQMYRVISNPPLMEALRIPLFLTLFAPLEENRNTILSATSRGEIFHTFFHKQTLSPACYTMQNRAQQVERDLSQAAAARQKQRIHAEMFDFILDFLLPELAWYMVHHDHFTIDTIDAEDVFQPIFAPFLDGTDPDALHICGKYASHVFQKLRNGQAVPFHTGNAARRFLEVFGTSITSLTEQIFDLSTFNLGILASDEFGNYRFLHQHIRDYFASRKVFNALHLALLLQRKGKGDLAVSHLDCLLRDPALNHTVRRFLYESLGEHKPEDPTSSNRILTHALDLFRMRDPSFADAVNILIRILIEARHDLIGVCLEGLDLQQCSLNGIPLSAPGQRVSLKGARITRHTFFPSGHTAPLRALLFHPGDGGKTLLTASWDGTLKYWDTTSGLCRKSRPIPKDTMCVKFSPSGRQILLITLDGLLVLDPDTGAQLGEIPGEFLDASFNYNETLLGITAMDGTVQMWTHHNGTYSPSTPLEGFPSDVGTFRFHPRKNLAMSLTLCGHLVFHDLDRNTVDCTHLDDGYYDEADFSPDGRFILLHNTFGLQAILDSETLESTDPVPVHMLDYRWVQYSPDGKQLLLLSGNNAILYDVNAKKKHSQFIGDFDLTRITGCFSPDGTRIALQDVFSAKLYDSASGAHLLTLGGSSSRPEEIHYHADGQRAIVAGKDGTARIWDIANRRCLHSLPGNGQALMGACFAPNGAPYALTSSRTQVDLWNAETGEHLRSYPNRWLSGPARFSNLGDTGFFAPEVIGLTFSDGFSAMPEEKSILDRVILSAIPLPEGWGKDAAYLTLSADLIATWDKDLEPLHTLTLRDACEALQTADFLFHEEFAQALPIPGAKTILIHHGNNVLTIWTSDFTTCLHTIQLDGFTTELSLSPDGTRVVSVLSDGTLSQIQITTDHRLEPLPDQITLEHIPLTPISFHPNGTRLLYACADGTVCEYDLITQTAHTFRDAPGLLVDGVDLSALGSHDLTAEDWDTLQCHGAILPPAT